MGLPFEDPLAIGYVCRSRVRIISRIAFDVLYLFQNDPWRYAHIKLLLI